MGKKLLIGVIAVEEIIHIKRIMKFICVQIRPVYLASINGEDSTLGRKNDFFKIFFAVHIYLSRRIFFVITKISYLQPFREIMGGQIALRQRTTTTTTNTTNDPNSPPGFFQNPRVNNPGNITNVSCLSGLVWYCTPFFYKQLLFQNRTDSCLFLEKKIPLKLLEFQKNWSKHSQI